jgi:nucleoside-diphosphate-sugar epimerase
MSKPLVLVTGATGHIGFGVLALLLKSGYRARVASRRLASVQKLKDLPSIRPYAESVSFIEVPDFLAEHAFDEAVKGVDYIVHLASPIPDPAHAGKEFDVRKDYVEPAVQGNLGLLNAAATSPTVKRIVITSSVAILKRGPEGTATKVGPDDLAPLLDISEYENLRDPRIAYAESKKQANAAVEKFVAQRKPHFDIVHVLPGYVQGRNEPVTSAKELRERVSSNTHLVNYVLGAKDEGGAPSNLVLLDDVAAVHVAALSSEIVSDGERFLATHPEEIPWDTLDPLVRKLFPREVESGLLPLGGSQIGLYIPYDPTKTTEKLGVKFHGAEDMVKSLIGQVVELQNAEAKN